jgi:hypothetical protein
MRNATFIFIVGCIIFSCKKKDNGPTPAPSPPPVITTDSSTFQILNTTKKDLNEFDISYIVNPPANQTYSSISLLWSTSVDFLTDKDSALISTTSTQPAVYHLTGLKQATTYYGRIGITYQGKRFYSSAKQWITDTFKIITAGYFGLARGLNKEDTTLAVTNFNQVLAVSIGTKVFIGNYECPVISDQGLTISFSVPASIPAGKYVFKIRRKGIEAQASDSTQVLRGKWSNINSPAIPGNPNAIASGLVFFGTCYSSQKGYMVGGAYFNGPAVPWPYSMYPEYIFELDGQTQTWTKKYPVNPHYIIEPICYYYNNSIYLIAGQERVLDQWGNDHGVWLKKMLRLDLGNLTWTVMDSLPYPTLFNLTSFELNNEWYIGMGADSANQSVCCGVPLPSKKFWKYNPTTNQWTQLANFPGGHQNFPTCFSIGSKGYAFYGAIPIGNPIIATSFTQELWEYNPATNAWTNIPLPTSGGPPAGEKYQVVSHNGKAYFLTAQTLIVTGLGYDYIGQVPCMEWDPTNPGVFKYVSFPKDAGNIMKVVYRNGNNFYFQSDALGYFTSIPNKTYSFLIEQ